MNTADLIASYQLIGELLLNPDDRTPDRIEPLMAQMGSTLELVTTQIEKFLASPTAFSRDEYVQTLELSPPCPLYLGSYLFDEPSTCNGVGSSGRNAYMLELIGLYQHFELDLASRELPDFLPVMVDFLWISLQKSDARDGKALRRWCLETHVLPGMEPLCESLEKYKSPYQHIVEALCETVEEDIRRLADTPPWRPPGTDDDTVSLPLLEESGAPDLSLEMQMTQSEFRP